KQGARKQMPVFKYFGTVGSALLALLFVSNALFGEDGSNSRFDGTFYQSTTFAPRPEQTAATPERHFTRDATPASRVKEVFAQFVPNENKRARRSSSAATVLR
ncbi:MAG: hypothetical protein Q7U92_04605, partial [Bradyrhizobium sp.]|nr:hypothetical protein [Bradyrhizobium sp.]